MDELRGRLLAELEEKEELARVSASRGQHGAGLAPATPCLLDPPL